MRVALLVHTLCVLWLAVAGGPAGAAPPPREAPDATAGDAGAAGEEVDEAALRDRLTEREDRRRVPDPWTRRVAGHPLTLEGEVEVETRGLRRIVLDPEARESDRLRVESAVEIELFYTLGLPLSFFAQAHLGLEKDTVGATPDPAGRSFVERGEMWAYSERIAGSHLSVEMGRLHFEDDRRWWWDDELDAVRLTYERSDFEVAIALARELGPERSDESRVAPEQRGVVRGLAEISWDWSENHAAQLFVLRQDDGSDTERLGDTIRASREDPNDDRLTWIGGRAIGIAELGGPGLFGYWLDAALLRGDSRELSFETLGAGRSEVVARQDRRVRAWALDAGIEWILPGRSEPRLFAAYALGSGDANPGDGTDHTFRQTALQGNEAGFGGVERFHHYGALLEPELANLHVLTIGAGISLLRSSSLDLVYHRYRLAERSTALPEMALEGELDGRHRSIGDALDLVLAVEEWEHFEFTLIGSVFRTGPAFGRERGTWVAGGLLSLRVPF